MDCHAVSAHRFFFEKKKFFLLRLLSRNEILMSLYAIRFTQPFFLILVNLGCVHGSGSMELK